MAIKLTELAETEIALFRQDRRRGPVLASRTASRARVQLAVLPLCEKISTDESALMPDHSLERLSSKGRCSTGSHASLACAWQTMVLS